MEIILICNLVASLWYSKNQDCKVLGGAPMCHQRLKHNISLDTPLSQYIVTSSFHVIVPMKHFFLVCSVISRMLKLICGEGLPGKCWATTKKLLKVSLSLPLSHTHAWKNVGSKMKDRYLLLLVTYLFLFFLCMWQISSMPLFWSLPTKLRILHVIA